MDALPPDLPHSLARPEAYPHDPSASEGVECIQTHLSHVFLTRERVAKLRKAVELSFVSFAERKTRNADCLREIELNRRLSPDVYLGIAEVEPVDHGGEGYRLGPVQPSPRSLRDDREHCVVMRRLPEGRDSRSLARAGALRPEWMDRAATRVARFHREHSLGRPAPFSPEVWWERNWGPARANFESIAAAENPSVDRARVDRLAELTRQGFEQRRERFEARRAEGRAVHGHGDLHLQHIWFPTDEADPVFIDCVEFSEDLRKIDGASEIAFLAMDLRHWDASPLAERVLRRYASELDDFGLYGVVDAFVSYRAAVRAKVAALAGADPEISDAQHERERAAVDRYLTLATEALEPRPPGPVLLVCGPVGTGKTTAAHALADQVGGVVVSSDRVRKQMLGRRPEEPTRAEEIGTLYAPERVARTYEAMLERAEPVARSGRPVVLDATYSRAKERTRARELAQRLGSPSLLLELRCDAPVAARRIQARNERGGDASDAGTERIAPSREQFEAPDEWPAEARLRLATDRDDWRERLRDEVRRRLEPGDAWT